MLSQTQTTKGRIAFYNSRYGFIKDDFDNSYHFFNKDIIDQNLIPNIFYDKVQFVISTNKSGPFRGKQTASEIEIIEPFDGTIHDAYSPILIGKVINEKRSNNNFIYTIDSPFLEKKTVLYSSRIIQNKNIKTDDLCVFYPVNSTNTKWNHFAYLAYKLEFEENTEFLKKIYKDIKGDHNILKLELREALNKILKLDDKIDLSFEESIFKLEPIDSIEKYSVFLELLGKYPEQKKYDSIKEIDISDKYLIMLFENKFIATCDLDLLKDYFNKALAAHKRQLNEILPKDKKSEIIKYHIDQLDNDNKLIRLNNSIKTILGILNINKDEYLYTYIFEILKENLNNKEIYQLWESGYILEIEDDIIESQMDFENEKKIQILSNNLDDSNKIYNRVIKYLQNKILEIIKIEHRNVNDELYLLKLVSIYSLNFPNEFDLFKLNNLKPVIGRYLETIFCLFFEDLFECTRLKEHIDTYKNELNSFYLVRALVRANDLELDLDKDLTQVIINNINQIKLTEFISDFKWDKIIYPTINGYHNTTTFSHFLPDIKEACESYESLETKINLKDLAIKIFERIPKFKTAHIRLWLYYLSDEYFDYVHFREPYKLLTNEEKNNFKNRSDLIEMHTVEDKYRAKIIHCEKITNKNDRYFEYDATLNNFYFSDDKIDFYFKINEVKYNESLSFTGSNIVYNTLSSRSEFINIPINVKVSNDNSHLVLEIIGMNYIFLLHEEKAVEWTLESLPSKATKAYRKPVKSYAEDWQLKKMVIDYLNSFERVFVAEPKTFTFRYDEDAPRESFEKTSIFKIPASLNESILVWENTDYADDRATYIFKTINNNLDEQIKKLKEAIETVSYFRSTLRSKSTGDEDSDKKSNTLKRYYGFLGVILKKRGRNNPFHKWKERLDHFALRKAPQPPTNEEWKKTKETPFANNKAPQTKSYPITSKRNKSEKTKKVPEKDIKIDDTFGGKSKQSTEEKLLNSVIEKLSEINSNLMLIE